jgi:hypothetical protein
MRDAVVYGIELAVGGACLVLAVGARRRDLRWIAAPFAVAGLAAVVHAVFELVT